MPTAQKPSEETDATLLARFEAQGRLLKNIQDNVETGHYEFFGGMKKYADWKARVASSRVIMERQALLVEADRLMQETRVKPPKQESEPPKKWKLW